MTWSWESITAPLVRNLVVDANDGIIATAGIVEGFAADLDHQPARAAGQVRHRSGFAPSEP